MRSSLRSTLLGAVLGYGAVAQRILIPNVLDGYERTVANDEGILVDLVSLEIWNSFTTADFANYAAIVFPDPSCARDPTILNFVEASKEIWSPAVTGNILIMGANAGTHRTQPGAVTLMQKSLHHVTSGTGTGLYISLSCYYEDAQTSIPAAMLSEFGAFTIAHTDTHSDSVHVVGSSPALAGLTDADLENWEWSVHAIFRSYPRNFQVLAIADAFTGPGAMEFGDGSTGIPYILANSLSQVGCGDGTLDTGEECDNGLLNGSEGNECTAACRCVIGAPNVPGQCPTGEVSSTTETVSSTTESVSSTTDSDESSTTESETATTSEISTTSASTVESTTSSSTQASSTSTEVESTSTDIAPTSSEETSVTSSVESTSETESVSSQDSTTQSSSSPSSTLSTSSTSSTSTVVPTPFPPVIDAFTFLGCTASRQRYAAFSLVLSSAEMDLDLCVAACAGRAYAGAHNTDCYCADATDDLEVVPADLCAIPCPGNALQNCGGERDAAAAVVRRQAVPDNVLLAVYYNPLLARPTITATAATATSVATTTATACAGPYCGGYIFEVCVGAPRPEEVVFALERCSCVGGWWYAPAPCRGKQCVGIVVYRPVPHPGPAPTGDVVVYEPSPCGHCDGGVAFVQPAPKAVVVAPPAGNGGHGGDGGSVVNGAGSVPLPTAPVVVAGADKATQKGVIALVLGLVGLLI